MTIWGLEGQGWPWTLFRSLGHKTSRIRPGLTWVLSRADLRGTLFRKWDMPCGGKSDNAVLLVTFLSWQPNSEGWIFHEKWEILLMVSTSSQIDQRVVGWTNSSNDGTEKPQVSLVDALTVKKKKKEWISNGVLLYSTQNYIQSCTMTYACYLVFSVQFIGTFSSAL